MHNVSTDLGQLGAKPIYPQIKHSYFIKNKGPSTVKEMQLIVLWPERTVDRESNLFELIAQPKICVKDIQNRARANCEHLDLNPNLEIPITRCKGNTLIDFNSSPQSIDQVHAHNNYGGIYDAAYIKPLRFKRDTITSNYEDEVCV